MLYFLNGIPMCQIHKYKVLAENIQYKYIYSTDTFVISLCAFCGRWWCQIVRFTLRCQIVLGAKLSYNHQGGQGRVHLIFYIFALALNCCQLTLLRPNRHWILIAAINNALHQSSFNLINYDKPKTIIQSTATTNSYILKKEKTILIIKACFQTSDVITLYFSS